MIAQSSMWIDCIPFIAALNRIGWIYFKQINSRLFELKLTSCQKKNVTIFFPFVRFYRWSNSKILIEIDKIDKIEVLDF